MLAKGDPFLGTISHWSSGISYRVIKY